MREELKKIENYRGVFTGTIERFGSVTNRWGCQTTLMLRDVKNETGKLMTDHLWFKCGKMWQKVRPMRTDTVRFNARVKVYYKRYGYDYRLSHPTNIEIIPPEIETPERVRICTIRDFCENFPRLAKKVSNGDLSLYLAFMEVGLPPITTKDRPWIQDQVEIRECLR